MAEELSIGRIVHQATRIGTIGGEWVPACKAALVVEKLASGVFLFGVFDRHGMDVRPLAHDEDKGEDTWHWPERVGQPEPVEPDLSKAMRVSLRK